MVIRIARFRLGRDVEGLSMRSSVRRRGRGVWELTVDVGRDAEGKRVRQFRTVRGTKAEAERVLNEMLRVAEFSQGLTSSRMLLGEFMERWLEGRMYPRLRSQTCVLYPREVRLRLGPELGNIPLHRLTTRDLSEMEYRFQGWCPRPADLPPGAVDCVKPRPETGTNRTQSVGGSGRGGVSAEAADDARCGIGFRAAGAPARK